MHNCAGICLIDDIRLEYQIISMEFIPGKSIELNAICLHPTKAIDRELVFKFKTNNLLTDDKRLEIALSIANAIIKDIELPGLLYKLSIREKNVYYICKI